MTRKDDARRPSQYNGLKLKGSYVIVVKKDGKVIDFRKGSNLVTTAGEVLTAKLLDFAGSEVPPKFIAFGSGTAGALKADTQLQTEIVAEPRVAGTSVVTGSSIVLTFQVTGTSTYTIEEMGIFNASVVGTMTSRFLTQPLSINVGVIIDITWTLSISGVD